tara:strand:- start:2805 stop:3548 length:744 start_codon:yes stop_codon:yes gene_type:complete
MRLRTIIGLCVPFLLNGLLFSQETAEPTPVEVRILVVDEVGEGFALNRGEQEIIVCNHPYEISRPVRFLGGDRLELSTVAYRKDEDGELEAEFSRVGSITVPEGSESVLIVFLPNKNRTEYFGRIYKDSDANFPFGSLRVINLSPSAIAFAAGGDREFLESGEVIVVSPEVDRKNRFLLKVADKKSDEWNILLNSVEVLRPSDRITGLVIYSPSGMRHTMTSAEIRMFGEPKPGNYWIDFRERRADP